MIERASENSQLSFEEPLTITSLAVVIEDLKMGVELFFYP